MPAGRRVHVVGAGPVGLLLTALLQPLDGVSVHLYEKRHEYTRSRMVQLAPRIAADTVARYREVAIDDVDYEAVFEVAELEAALAFRREIPSDLAGLIADWVVGFCPLNTIERALSDLIDERASGRASGNVERTLTALDADAALALLEPGDVMIDCTGTKSLLRDRLLPTDEQVDGLTNTHTMLFEHALVVTFLYGQTYDCNEYCKYYKNVGTEQYKFIPAVHRTFNDGAVTHVTGLIKISPEDYTAMPAQFDGQWLREHFPGVADSVEHFVEQIKEESHGEIVGDLHIIRIPLNLYRARHATSRRLCASGPSGHPLAATPVILAGDSAIGSPYFQSISLGFECAMYLAGLIADPALDPDEMLDRYETYCFKQWMRVYMRSKMIKHNKDLFESVDDTWTLLEQLPLY